MILFGPTHLSTLTLISLVTLSCVICQRKGHRWPRFFLAFLCLNVFTVNQWSYLQVSFPVPLNNTIPGHLCDLVAFLMGFGLLFRHALSCELAYTWGLGGTLQALITPNLSQDFPDPIFLSFFHAHGVIVVAALFLPLGLRWSPRPGVVLRSFAWLQLYFVAAIGLNLSLGTNFGFLMQKPQAASLFDYLGPWPWYWLALQPISLLLILLPCLPFRRSRNIWLPWTKQAKPSP